MTCPSCHHVNPAEARFCRQCGSRLAITCPNCREEHPPNTRFCSSCGTALGDSPAPTASPSRAATLPASFANGRYTVVRFLGEGGKKQVYLAHDTMLDRDVAFALIKTDGLDETGIERIRREARLMGRLGGHPHIVSVFDMGEEAGQPFLVSELMAGGDVEGLIASAPDHRPPLADSLRIADEVCQALAYAHEHGIIHRDLKPGNVWLTKDGTAKLGDFGLAMAIDKTRLSIAGMIVGTVGYMPPEQALGRAPDARSDLYSLGAMLYELVTGRPPFLGDDPVAIISQHVNTPPVAPSWHNPRVPRALEALILRLLEKDPDRRPASAADVRAELAGIVASATGQPTTSELREAAEQANPLDRLAGGVFVGRERELEQLRAAIDGGMSGRGGIVLVAGEPGIGKTRLVEEVATYATLRGAQVLWGRAYEWEGAPAYWSWVQILRDYVLDRDPQALRAELGSGAAVIAQVVSAVRERLPDVPEPSRTEGDAARFRLFDAIATFLKNAGVHQPLVLVLDDLQWADQPSLALLPFVVRELRSARVTIVGIYRDAEVGRHHPLAATLADLAREPRTQRIILRGLSQTDVTRYLTLTTGRDQTDRMGETIYRETEGNAFFVSEVVRLLASEGRLEGSGSPDSVTLPQGVREVIGRRLDRLSKKCNEILAIAAVIGREFSLQMLEPVSGRTAAELLDLIEEALKARVIREGEGAGQYRFSQELIQETLYAELAISRRLRLHGIIGETLERLPGPRRDSQLSAIAYHYGQAAQAGYADQAIAFAVQAAERAFAQLGYEEAIGHYQRALQILELQAQPDERKRCEILLALGNIQGWVGAVPESLATYGRAASLARELEDAELLARAALASDVYAYIPQEIDDVTRRLLEEALARLPRGDSQLRAKLLSRLAVALYSDSSRSDERLAMTDEAVAIATRLDDAGVLGYALVVHWNAGLSAEQLPERIATATEIVRIGEARGDPILREIGEGWLSGDLLEAGQIADAKHGTTTIQNLLTEWRLDADLTTVVLQSATYAFIAGDLNEVERLIAQPIMKKLYDVRFALPLLLSLKIEQGSGGELEPEVLALAGRVTRFVYPRVLPAYLYASLGLMDEARPWFESLATKEFAELHRDERHRLFCLALLSEVSILLADTERAAQLYALLLPFADRFIVRNAVLHCLGSAQYYLGRLAAALDRWDAAEQHYIASLDANTRLGAHLFVAHTRHAYADMLVRRDAPGDRERALPLVDQALADAERMGATRLAGQALALKVRLQGILKA